MTVEPTAIAPDAKDWTWVLDETCPECGFDAASVDVGCVGSIVRNNADDWQRLLHDRRAVTRPTPSQWSAWEYACHVRDVFRLFDERLELMLDTDAPRFANWDQDATAVAERYHQQVPAVVALELLAAGSSCADRWDRVGDDQWARTGFRSDGAAFTVDSFARYFLHDPLHHVVDVERGYSTIE